MFVTCTLTSSAKSVPTTHAPYTVPADMLEYGFLDVTLPPFDVDNTGAVDVTLKLQKAIVYARQNYLVVYFPHGTYLVSDTLVALEVEKWNPALPPFPSPSPRASNNTHPCRFQPNVLVGERAKWDTVTGEPVRPIIKLVDNAPGFDDISLIKPVLDFTRSNNSKHQPTVDGTNFNQLFRGIDVHIGKGTPGATGVQLPGAQGCSVQDSTIQVGSGYSGITGGAGAGGGHAMLTVIGGRIGLDYTLSLNCPGTAGARLLDQTEAAILYSGLEAASFTGAYIRPANANVAALKSIAHGIQFGQVSMVDCVIDYPDSGANENCVAMDTTHSLYLNNVFLKNCGSFASGVAAEKSSQYSVAHEVAIGVSIPTDRSCGNISMPVYRNGVRVAGNVFRNTSGSSAGPGESVLSKHRWNERTFPTWDAPGVVNAKQFGALGDGSTDDAGAIQKAIDAAATTKSVVFLPKGFYRLSKTLTLTSPCAGIVGTARSLTVLMPMSVGLEGSSPILHVPGNNNKITISMFTIVTWEHLDTVWAMHWENTNKDSIYRQNYFYRITECFFGFPHPTPVPVHDPTIPCKPSATLAHPLNLLENGASGKFYNFENEDFLYEAPEYRHLLVEHGNELKFYNLNMEHSSSEANAEFRSSKDVNIYSLKSEGEWRDTIFNNGQANPDIALWVRNCTNFNAFSYGGNLKPLPTGRSYPQGFAQYPTSLYRFENTCPMTVTNLVDQISFPKDNDWNFVYEWYRGRELLTAHCERPVLFSRVDCSGK